MRKGINSWCLPTTLTRNEIFQEAKAAGFETIELNMADAHADANFADELGLVDTEILTTETTEQELLGLKNLSEKFALPISSVATALHWSYPLNANDEKVREKGKMIARKMIDACHILGGDTVLIVPGVVTEDADYATCYERAKEALLELAPYAKEKGVVIGVENVWNKFLLSPLEMKRFIDEIGDPNVKVYFDAGNVLQFAYPEQWVAILGSRIQKVHIKDFSKVIGNIHGFTGLLAGDMNWPKLMESLQTIGYDGPLTCELTPYRENPLQLSRDASQAMDYILACHKK
ncbi:sugar phosphate isomerase/epimerase family protein [Listeria goaensis]|uniref:sugar phosphate isomerase/epimerase family protein n=1 Tax=Listeria goaensis TaxID=1649188 RepID=UPI000B596C76|nr:sugar phosphate isomerase/epimerase family protein [Listeria goaensis]